MADFDRLSKQVEDLAVGEKNLSGDVEAFQEILTSASQEVHGFAFLRVVAHEEEFPIGRCLQLGLAMRLV